MRKLSVLASQVNTRIQGSNKVFGNTSNSNVSLRADMVIPKYNDSIARKLDP